MTVSEKIESVANRVKQASFHEKTRGVAEIDIDSFLDKILTFQKYLADKTIKVDQISSMFENLTWIEGDLTENDLRLINEVISAGKDLRTSLIKRYIKINTNSLRSIASKEINLFKASIDNLTETYRDVEDVFFNLPNDNELNEAIDQFKLI
jgi:hypothetical protein